MTKNNPLSLRYLLSVTHWHTYIFTHTHTHTHTQTHIHTNTNTYTPKPTVVGNKEWKREKLFEKVSTQYSGQYNFTLINHWVGGPLNFNCSSGFVCTRLLSCGLLYAPCLTLNIPETDIFLYATKKYGSSFRFSGLEKTNAHPCWWRRILKKLTSPHLERQDLLLMEKNPKKADIPTPWEARPPCRWRKILKKATSPHLERQDLLVDGEEPCHGFGPGEQTGHVAAHFLGLL